MRLEETRKHMLRAGAARVDITPAAGIPLTGFIARAGPSLGIHDPLYARALALEAGGQRAVLITCDLLALDSAFVCAARSAIREATGILDNNILIACTHTHSGPATIFLRDCGEVDATYLDRLRLGLVSAAQEALSNLREAKLGAGRGKVARGALNRRQPGTPTDPDLGVVAFQDQVGQRIAVLVHYACHPVCLDHRNRLVSADYPGTLAQALKEQAGAVVLFANGAAGDINPERMGSFADAEALGQALAAETLRVLETIEYQDTARLQVAGEMLDLPLKQPPSRAEIDQQMDEYRRRLVQAEESGNALEIKQHKAMLGWAKATAAGMTLGSLVKVVPAEVQVICLGDAALVGIPGEIFGELGRQIKEVASGQALVVGYANADIGYIPTRQAYALGGYEIEAAFKYYGYPAPLAPEAGELLLQTAARMIQRCSGSRGSSPQ